MAERFHVLGLEAMMAGMYALLGALFLPITAGLVTAPGRLVDSWWLIAAAYTAGFGLCLIAIGYGLTLLVAVSTSLARRFLSWRHSRVWRTRIS